uniref:EGF-like domain-containing protein n=1 Tax=Hippocampus comes TaxID=109280 RepID=A0A3Q2YG90_HIPCM
APGAARGGPDRLQVMFTPTICKVRCSQRRCVNHCERGNVTTLFSGPATERPNGDRFRVVCRLLCKNGGVCLLKDRCLCPSNFTGKFCQIPVTSQAMPSFTSPNEIVKPPRVSVAAPSTDLTRSEFLLPLRVKVRVQHPPEASVKVHQVMKVRAPIDQFSILSSCLVLLTVCAFRCLDSCPPRNRSCPARCLGPRGLRRRWTAVSGPRRSGESASTPNTSASSTASGRSKTDSAVLLCQAGAKRCAAEVWERPGAPATAPS